MRHDTDQAPLSTVEGGRRDEAFFGHPRGFAVLAFTGGWIDVSLHGMQSLLVLCMTGALLRPGRPTIALGYLPMTAGHFPMAVDASFLLALRPTDENRESAVTGMEQRSPHVGPA